MSDLDEWCLIESDPGVMTSMIRDFGVTGVQVEELYSLDPICYDEFKPVHGLIFLFKVVSEDYSDGVLLQDEKILSKLFFAKQVIKNACGTQALINILMNCNHEDLKLGQTLSDFKEYTSQLDAEKKGMSLVHAERIRSVHNSFAGPKELNVKNDKKTGYHFTGYVPFGGRLIELDGRQKGPFDLGPIVEGTDWVATARPHIEKRMSKYGNDEIGFNLMALVSDKKMLYTRRIAELQAKGTSGDALEIEHLKMLIADEDAKNERYKVENIRRKHNYLPLIVDILTVLAEEGKLVEQFDKAKEKSIQQANLKKKNTK